MNKDLPSYSTRSALSWAWLKARSSSVAYSFNFPDSSSVVALRSLLRFPPASPSSGSSGLITGSLAEASAEASALSLTPASSSSSSSSLFISQNWRAKEVSRVYALDVLKSQLVMLVLPVLQLPLIFGSPLHHIIVRGHQFQLR
jgi:hypothetical protein